MVYTYDTEKILRSLPNKLCNFKEGDTAFIKETKKVFQFVDGEWKAPKGSLSLSLREINKQIFSQAKPIEDYSSFEENLNNFLDRTKDNFYVFTNNYDNTTLYLTIFEYKDSGSDNFKYDSFASGIEDCIKSLGTFKGFDFFDMIGEIWIQDDEDVKMYLLFPYSEGRIYYE